MSQLMLVNPKARKKPRSAAQKAATRRLVASNKSRGRKRGTSITRSRTVKTSVRRRRNPIRRGITVNRVMDTTIQGAQGSVGAIAGSIVNSYLPLPANLKIGNMGKVIAALIGIGTGYAVARFGKQQKLGENMARGSVTVALHGTMVNALATTFPNLTLADDLLGDDYNGLLGNDYNDDLSAYVYEDQNIGAYDMGYAGAGYTGDTESDPLNF